MSVVPSSAVTSSLAFSSPVRAASAPGSTQGFVNAPRIHKALTASAERKVILYLAARMPARINSDHLTLLGFAGQILAGASYALARHDHRWLMLATFFILVNWLGDSLDGTLARVRAQQRPRYGFYVDHMLDAFGATFLMGGLAMSGYLHWQTAAAMLLGFLLLSIETYLATYTLGSFHLSQGWFGPTELRLLLIMGNVALAYHPMSHIFGRAYLLFDVGGAVGAAGMAVMAASAAVRHTMELYRLEPLPRAGASR